MRARACCAPQVSDHGSSSQDTSARLAEESSRAVAHIRDAVQHKKKEVGRA